MGGEEDRTSICSDACPRYPQALRLPDSQALLPQHGGRSRIADLCRGNSACARLPLALLDDLILALILGREMDYICGVSQSSLEGLGPERRY